MEAGKIVKSLGIVVLATGLFAGGYWWGQRDKDDSSSASHGPATLPPVDPMSGHDMGSGSIEVSPDKQQLIGMRTAVVEARPLIKKIRTVGIVSYDETKVAQVFTKVEGWIDQLFVDYTGKLVKKKQPLFTMYSPDLVATQEEYLLALEAKDALASSSLQEVRQGSASLLDATRRRLSFWDISDEQIEELQKTRKPQKSLTIFSPIGGFVTKKEAYQGMKVMPDKELYTIADLSTVWVNADIYEFELGSIRVGQKAAMALSYAPGRTLTGTVAWISPVLDEKTRTAKVRIEFANQEFVLKPEMYANVEIDIDSGRKLAIPDEAVLDSGLRKVVFLDKGEGRFEPAEVKLGNKFDGYYEVLSGLSQGQRILASAGFFLDSESRLKEAMGAMAGMAGHGDMKGMETKAPPKAGPQERKVQDLTLVLSTLPEKPKAGENVIRLKITDKSGNIIRDAQVSFVFNMTMPGMVPSKGEGKLSKDGFYETRTSLAMAGEWEVTATIRRPGQREIQEKFRVMVYGL
jgi:Cu(I)/Ag(I) efflux system membrane fusion protein